MFKPLLSYSIKQLLFIFFVAALLVNAEAQTSGKKVIEKKSTSTTDTAKRSSTITKAIKSGKIKYSKKPGTVIYGQASYYANMFNGRQTANGEIFSQQKFTAACNVLPLGTWISVTNLRNGKSVIVRTTDRLHPRMNRVVDLSKIAAQRIGYIGRGLTRVKIVVMDPNEIRR
ncbi:MAG: septal ring lytic transglycosylase RlpA family protein [Ferruginibacter sp.]